MREAHRCIRSRTLLDLISRAAVNGLDINHQGRVIPAYLLLADPDLVPLLGIHALWGNLQRTLTQRDGIAINLTLLRKLWGELPLEETLVIDAKAARLLGFASPQAAIGALLI